MSLGLFRLLALGCLIAAAGCLVAGCSRMRLDSNAGNEAVVLRSIDHPKMRVEYLRTPEEGPLRWKKNAWWLFWGGVPLNHPDPSRWRAENLPTGATPANERYMVNVPWYGYIFLFGTIGIVQVQRTWYEVDPVRVTWVEEAASKLPLEPAGS